MKYQLVSDSWGKEEINAIHKVIKSRVYTYRGKYVKEFEKKFANFFGVKYGVMVNSGSSANLLSIASLFFKKKNSPFACLLAPALQPRNGHRPRTQRHTF